MYRRLDNKLAEPKWVFGPGKKKIINKRLFGDRSRRTFIKYMYSAGNTLVETVRYALVTLIARTLWADLRNCVLFWNRSAILAQTVSAYSAIDCATAAISLLLPSEAPPILGSDFAIF